jgi:hypothetical protein
MDKKKQTKPASAEWKCSSFQDQNMETLRGSKLFIGRFSRETTTGPEETEIYFWSRDPDAAVQHILKNCNEQGSVPDDFFGREID